MFGDVDGGVFDDAQGDGVGRPRVDLQHLPVEVYGAAANLPVALRAPSVPAAINPAMNPSKKSLILV